MCILDSVKIQKIVRNYSCVCSHIYTLPHIQGSSYLRKAGAGYKLSGGTTYRNFISQSKRHICEIHGIFRRQDSQLLVCNMF